MKMFAPNIPMVISAVVGIIMLSACVVPASNYGRVYTAPYVGHAHSGRHHRKPNLRAPRHQRTIHPGAQKKRGRNFRDLHRARKKYKIERPKLHREQIGQRPEANHDLSKPKRIRSSPEQVKNRETLKQKVDRYLKMKRDRKYRDLMLKYKLFTKKSNYDIYNKFTRPK